MVGYTQEVGVLVNNSKNGAMGKAHHLKVTVMEVMEILDQLINKTKMHYCNELN